MLRTFTNSISRNLFEPEHPDSLGTKVYYRLFELFTVVYSIIYVWKWGLYTQRLSDVVLPLGLAQYIDVELFLGTYFPLVNAGLLTIFVISALFFDKAKWLYGVAFILLHLQYVTRYSQGEIPHSQNMVGFCLLGLGIGSVFFKDREHSLHFGLGFVVFFLGLGYTTAAFSKLVATGVTWVDGHHLWLWIAEKGTDVLSDKGTFQLNWVQEAALQSRTVATLFLTAGLLTEFFAFLVWWKRYRTLMFIGIIGLHMGIYITMNILFLSYTIGLCIIGLPWHRVIDQGLKYFGKMKQRSVQSEYRSRY
ncbi:hypothetical protein ACG2F4_14555 [Halalkalibaculum sp. DA3122]|uniref:hypothetical protein n=1 Tax=unclassified Halalkalibaculum TaxID=2964617 RepID=UPI0037541B4D